VLVLSAKITAKVEKSGNTRVERLQIYLFTIFYTLSITYIYSVVYLSKDAILFYSGTYDDIVCCYSFSHVHPVCEVYQIIVRWQVVSTQ